MKKIFFLILVYLLNTEFLLAKDYISKNPNHLKRGLIGKVYIKKYENKNIYKIINDPTGTSPIEKIEKIEIKTGDCSNEKYSSTKNTTDCNTLRQRFEIRENHKSISKKKVKRNPIERWYGYYMYLPDNFPINDKPLRPVINQFQHWDIGHVNTHLPTIYLRIVLGDLYMKNKLIIENKDLVGKWNKIEYQIKWSIRNDGFLKIYHNNQLKYSRENFVTLKGDYLYFKYGIYNWRDFGISYPYKYEFPDQTIYFAGVSASKKREDLKVNKIK
jgi:hypothetical protein